MKHLLALLILIALCIPAEASQLAASGSFNAGGDTTAEAAILYSSGDFDDEDFDMYWWPTTSNHAATITQGAITHTVRGDGFALAGWDCDNGDKVTWSLPDISALDTEGTLWLTLYVSTTTWSGTDGIHIASLRNETTTCHPTGGYTSSLEFFIENSGYHLPAWGFYRFDCNGTPYSRRLNQYSTPNFTSGWYRLAFTWKFEDGDFYSSVSMGGTWYDDDYSIGADCTAPTESFQYFEIGGECWPDNTESWCTATGEGNMAVDDIYLLNGFKTADPL